MPTTTYLDVYTDFYSDFYGLQVITPDIIPPPPVERPPVPTQTGLLFYDGTQHLLDGTEGVTLLQGVHGLDMPAIRTNRAAVAGQPGTRLQTVQHDLRQVELPVVFNASSPEQLRALVALWLHYLDPTRGNGELWFATTNGTRVLTCRYQEGLEALEDGDPRELQAVLVFGADDPYWYDFDSTQKSWALSGVVPKWFNPPSKSILPLTFAASTVLGTNLLQNDGDVDAWPVWTIDGPATSVTVHNQDSDEVFVWAHSLAAGDRLIVDTRPGIKTVLLNGAPAFNYLTSYQLFSLPPGPTFVTVLLAGADTGSHASVEWRQRYLGPA